MSDDPKAGPNAEQAAYWGETSGPKWVALQERIDAQIAPIGLEAIDRAGPVQGEIVFDVGCGCGQTTLQLAERVGADGRVSGFDLSAPMLARARERAAEAGFAVDFLEADAQIHPFEPGSANLVFSRFGVMFFEDPVAAFGNLRRALAPGGRLVFACWRALGDNPWVTVPMVAAAQHVTFEPPADPHGPGPFSLAEADRIEGLLGKAGFAEVSVEPLDLEIEVGGRASLSEVVDFVLQIGPTARALADADASVVEAVRASVREAVEPHVSEDGVLRLGSATWIVTARP